jgi:ATP-dependent Clp protease protease subunit
MTESRFVPVAPDDLEQSRQATYDIFSRLLRERSVFVVNEVEPRMASVVCAQLLFLDKEQPGTEIKMYIDSPGGSISAGMSIYDTMQLVESPVSTVCLGMAASMASVLLMGGEQGRRFALPNSEILIHQPLTGIQGQASDIAIHALRIVRMKTHLIELYHLHTGQPKERVAKDIERDYFLSADEAKTYGIVDDVIQPTKNIYKIRPSENGKNS